MTFAHLRERWLNWFGLVAHSSGAFSQNVIITLMAGTGQRGEGGR